MGGGGFSGAEFAPFPSPLPPSSSGDGAALLCSFSVPLFCEPPGVCSRRSIFLSLSHNLKELPPTALKALGPVPTLSNAPGSSPFRPHLLVVGAGVWGTFLLGVAFRRNLWALSNFSSQLGGKTYPPAGGFPGDWKLPLLRLPSRDESPSLVLLCPFFNL